MKSFIVLSFLIIFQGINAQTPLEEARAFQESLNEFYSDAKKSPLKKKDFENFNGLIFFELDEKYVVTATLKRTPKEKPFQMPTTTDRKPWYVKYGELTFKIEGKKYKLNVYKSVEPSKNPEYANSLFLPFTDLTSGNESYGGGRYMDIQIPEGKEVVLNFHKAYNPYCAYNERYSCPLTPPENDLKVEIRAGVKAFK